jgi:hypothetical protein
MIKRVLLLMLIATAAFAQTSTQLQLYRNDAEGNIQYRRTSKMDGNLVRTLYSNDGEVGQWPYSPSGEWPKGSGHGYLDGVALLIASEVTAPGTNQIIHPLQTNYREWTDKDPKTGDIWGLEPVPGYLNENYTKIAINTDPKSWPTVWPAALGVTPDWNGFWYGYFGKGVQNADQETFYVMDDSKDKEWTRAPYKYYPIKSDTTRGGLGLRIEVRGFQWSHVLAEDMIFWHYDIVNLADIDYLKTFFGFYTDCGVGGKDDSSDDCASFDVGLDIAYAYDFDGKGVPNDWKTGMYGYAYLESPGNGYDGIDNDGDGMVDERRDDGIDNNHNWTGYVDVNHNGKWDADQNEPLNDDVGKDGIGPLDPGYTGPDEGEGDGLPTEGEPNFDKTDKDESDQIGLTAVSLYRLGDGGVGGGWPKDDEPMWLKMSSAKFDTSLQKANISMVFASGPFPLNQGKRERFSMALLFGDDKDDLFFNKETVQSIYNANYNFSKPPLKPTLTAVPSNGKVYLYWDKVAEDSRDRFLGYEGGKPENGYKKDFEGYLLYRSQEAEFNDLKVITDSKGAAKYWKPMAQWDLIDSIKGPDPVGINGASFWRGSNTGLTHSYIDTDVKNGTRYFYALVSYDKGDTHLGTKGLQPTECTKIISEDNAGNITFVDYNCAVVTPNAPAAGYVPAQVIGDVRNVTSGLGTGHLNVELLNPSAIKEGANYKVSFKSSGTDYNPASPTSATATAYAGYKTTTFNVVRTYNGITDTLQKNLDTSQIGASKFLTPFDGLTFSVVNDSSNIVDTLTGWTVGKSNVTMAAFQGSSALGEKKWPADYEIQFFGAPVDTTYIEYAKSKYYKFPINFQVINKTTGLKCKVAIKDYDDSKSLTLGDEIDILEFFGPKTLTNAKTVAKVSYMLPMDPTAQIKEPVAGDKFFIKQSKPFFAGDFFSFTVKASAVDKDKAKGQLGKIGVVPNPYICTNAWERRNLNSTGRGERRIEFINLPAKCTLRIYTVAGALVKTLQKDGDSSDGSLYWNLLTEDGMDIAYGVYLYHVDAPGIGQQIGKFAVIK